MDVPVYKILTQEQWDAFEAEGICVGSPIDLQDGFIHLCGASQVEGVIARYYAGQRPLYIVEFRASDLGNDLRWEASTQGDVFPHLYDRTLDFEKIKSFRAI